MRADRERIKDMIDALQRIQERTEGVVGALSDELIQTWVIRHIEILGEAARAVSAELRADHPEIAWSEIVTMRNLLIHRYFDVDATALDHTVEQVLPTLNAQLEEILTSLRDES